VAFGAVRVFDVDLIDGRQPCIVMELLDGEDLAVRIGKDGPIAPDVAVDWLLQLCDGVAEAHAIGIVHRDLKPANVFVTRDGVEALDYLNCAGQFAGRPSGTPAVILLDLKLPKVNGLEVLRRIRADPNLRRFPWSWSPPRAKSRTWPRATNWA